MNPQNSTTRPVPRSRTTRALITLMIIAAGLATRLPGVPLPVFIQTYGGDTLWALMVFTGLGFLFPNLSSIRLMGAAWLFCIGIEVSQLYHAPWIDAVRATRLGGLILGYGFLWSDLLCYSVGIGLGALGEVLRLKPNQASHPTHR